MIYTKYIQAHNDITFENELNKELITLQNNNCVIKDIKYDIIILNNKLFFSGIILYEYYNGGNDICMNLENTLTSSSLTANYEEQIM